MDVPVFILSVLSTVCICIPALLKGKNMKLILLFIFFTNVLVGANYILTGAFNGAVSCCVGAVQTIINYFFERKNKPLPSWLFAVYALAFAVVNLLVFRHIADTIPLLATLVFVIEISQKNGKTFRIWRLVNTGLWILYDLVSLSLGPLSTHIIQLSTILLGMVIHDRKQANV